MTANYSAFSFDVCPFVLLVGSRAALTAELTPDDDDESTTDVSLSC